MKSAIAQRVKSFQSAQITEFVDLAKSLKDPVDLSIGMPYGPMTPSVRAAASRALEDGQTAYQPAGGGLELRRALASKLVRVNAIKATPRSTLVTPGVSGGLFLAFASVLDPGDEIIIPDPFFLAYRELAIMLDAVPVFLDTYPTFELKPSEIEKLITGHTKAVLINSPNNPAGSVYPKEALKELADICRRHGIVVISDEVYEDFVHTGEHFSIGSVYQPTITLNGFSKNHAMTGLRIGYAHCEDAEIVQAMTELAQFVFFSNSSIGEAAAMAAINVAGNPHHDLYRRNRDYVTDHLDRAYSRSSGDGSFFFFLKHPSVDGRTLAKLALLKSLIVIPGNIFSQRESHFRISYAADNDVLRRGVEILNDLVR